MARRRQKTKPQTPQLELSGALCLAFVNTAISHPKNLQLPVSDYAELLSWSRSITAKLVESRIVRIGVPLLITK